MTGIRLNAIAAGQFGTDALRTKYRAQMAGGLVSGSVLTVDGARDNWLGLAVGGLGHGQ